MKQKGFGSIPSPHPVHDETKRLGSIPLPHPLDATAKKIKMAICIKSTNLKLEKTEDMLEIVFLGMLNMLNSNRLALIATEM